MNQPKPALLQTALILAIFLFFLLLIVAGGSFVTALAGINPEYHDKRLVYQVSQNAVDAIWNITLVAILASLVVAVVAALNFRFKNRILNILTLIACGVLLSWAIFAGWALSSEYLPEDDSSGSSSQQEGTDLRIRSINLN